MREMMDVIIDGHVENRPVDRVDEIRFIDGRTEYGLSRPKLHEGEEAFHCMDGSVYVVKLLTN